MPDKTESKTTACNTSEGEAFPENCRLPADIAAFLSHNVGNPAHSVYLSLTSFEKIWYELVPVLDSYTRKYGDFEIGGYLYSELKKSMPQLLQRAQENTGRIKRIVHFLHPQTREG